MNLHEFIRIEIERELEERNVVVTDDTVEGIASRVAAALHAGAIGKHDALKLLAETYTQER